MEDVLFRVAQRDDYHRLVPWLVEISQAPEQQCLHTWVSGSAAELEQQLLSYLDDGELCYVLALRNGGLVGAMGSEYDQELGRGWLHGPHAVAERWGEIAVELFARLRAALPPAIKRVYAGLNVENERGRRFYVACGFEEEGVLAFDLLLTPADRVASNEGRCGSLEPVHAPSFIQLYQEIFPLAYYSGERVVRMIGQSHQVFVAARGKDVLGFVVAAVDEARTSGEIQFLGVREDRRGRGYGRRLLISAIDWLLGQAGLSEVSLAVNERNHNALRLYQSVGFRLRNTGVGLTKELSK